MCRWRPLICLCKGGFSVSSMPHSACHLVFATVTLHSSQLYIVLEIDMRFYGCAYIPSNDAPIISCNGLVSHSCCPEVTADPKVVTQVITVAATHLFCWPVISLKLCSQPPRPSSIEVHISILVRVVGVLANAQRLQEASCLLGRLLCGRLCLPPQPLAALCNALLGLLCGDLHLLKKFCTQTVKGEIFNSACHA